MNKGPTIPQTALTSSPPTLLRGLPAQQKASVEHEIQKEHRPKPPRAGSSLTRKEGPQAQPGDVEDAARGVGALRAVVAAQREKEGNRMTIEEREIQVAALAASVLSTIEMIQTAGESLIDLAATERAALEMLAGVGDVPK